VLLAAVEKQAVLLFGVATETKEESTHTSHANSLLPIRAWESRVIGYLSNAITLR